MSGLDRGRGVVNQAGFSTDSENSRGHYTAQKIAMSKVNSKNILYGKISIMFYRIFHLALAVYFIALLNMDNIL